MPRLRRLDSAGLPRAHPLLHHAIGGFAQQQSQGGSLTFTSQHRVVDVASLPVGSVNGAPAAPPSGNAGQATDIVATIEKLAGLHNRGIMIDNEFSSKKADLLSRL